MILLAALAASSADVWHTRHDEADTDAPPVLRRHDRGSPLLTPVRTADGFLLVEGVVARPGIYVYRNADGTPRRELVTEQTLRDSASTLGRAPVTNDHPDDANVTPENVQRWGVGDVGDEITIADNGFVRVKMAVRRKDAIDAIEGGKVQLSPGYDVKLSGKGGEDPIFGRFDDEQTSRRYNHVAIVDAARGGSACAVRSDALDEVVEEAGEAAATAAALTAILARLGVATPQEAQAKIDAEWSKLYAQRDVLNGLLTLLACDNADAARAKIDGMMKPPAPMAMDRADGLAWHVARRALDTLAETHGVKNADALADAELRKAIVVAANPEARADGDDAYYDAALAFLPRKSDPFAGLRFDAKGGNDPGPSAPRENPHLAAMRRS
jgi:hypothetical protein